MSFTPKVNERLTVDGANYRFTEHPAAPGLPYGQRGKRAEVYQIIAPDASLHALKVFVSAYRSSQIVANTARLHPYTRFPGHQNRIFQVRMGLQ
jgi:hypothetical protein